MYVNKNTYKKHCDGNILIQFMRQQYPDDNYVFLPDLASAHYGKNVIALLDSESINYVLKKDDPAS